MNLPLSILLERAIEARKAELDAAHHVACRLFNGPREGCPELFVDLYGSTVVLHNYADPPEMGAENLIAAQAVVCNQLPWVCGIIIKERKGETDQQRHGRLIDGEKIDKRIRENGIWYAIDLLMNQDASFYLDTRLLRKWLIEKMAGGSVLNTFAYTGGLGVAAAAGGASRVVQTDRNKRFLNVSKISYSLNGFPIQRRDFQSMDFWAYMKRLNRAGERFDCVILDPPFYSTTSQGTIDLNKDMHRLINKVRPLVNHGGLIVAVNNALYLSGQAYMESLNELCIGGYVDIEEVIPVPEECIGYPSTIVAPPVTDPTPFNHSTKIVVLRILHKV
ncbi:MAG: class I SAM-dependent methyltransferase [Chloroflexota bacterium]